MLHVLEQVEVFDVFNLDVLSLDGTAFLLLLDELILLNDLLDFLPVLFTNSWGGEALDESEVLSEVINDGSLLHGDISSLWVVLLNKCFLKLVAVLLPGHN
jgi:hypothetical protein